MKRLGCFFFIAFVVVLFVLYQSFSPKQLDEQSDTISNSQNSEEDFTKQLEEEESFLENDDLSRLVGENVTVVKERFGSADRIDKSAYGFDWWIYRLENTYIQFGVKDDKVTSLYAIGEEINVGGLFIGLEYSNAKELVNIESHVSFTVGTNSYRFELTEEELLTRPLVSIGDKWAQLYFDQFTEKLSSTRILNMETLLKQRPYSLTYRGELPEEVSLTKEEWAEIERGAAQQILDVTNMIRIRHTLPILDWNEEVANVAFFHSKDMFENNYFAHTSPIHGELKDRLEKEDIIFQLAAENIAAQYVDAIAAVEGWLNSEGHRVNLLHEDFTELGVGVYEKYYTQNFITPWKVPN